MYIYLYTSDKRVTLLREVSAMVDSPNSSSFSLQLRQIDGGHA